MDESANSQGKNASTAITQGDVLKSNMHSLAFFEAVEDRAGKKEHTEPSLRGNIVVVLAHICICIFQRNTNQEDKEMQLSMSSG